MVQMKVTTIIEQEDGNYVFTAELSKDQHSFLLEYAIKDLMVKGLLPFAMADGESISKVAPGSTEIAS